MTYARSAPRQPGYSDGQVQTVPAVPGRSARPARYGRYPRRLADRIRRHLTFGVALILAVALRATAMAGFRPILWFPDASGYLVAALSHSLGIVRPSGYPALLSVLHPLHSIAVIALVQHLMGLGVAVAIYALLRRRGLPGWGATLAALPVLFDAYQVQLEHLLLADTLFLFLVTVAIVLVCWNDRPGGVAGGVAGLLIGYATVTRLVGLPLLAVVAVCLAVRRAGWRPVAALVVAGAVPVVSYAAAFHEDYGTVGLTDSGGIFLYDRVMAFANCAVIKPPPALAALCDPRPQSQRFQPPLEYIWDHQDPIQRLARSERLGLFSPRINGLAERFARRAILAQPLDYLGVVASDTLRSFGWGNRVTYDANDRMYQFMSQYQLAEAAWQHMRGYQPGLPPPRVVQPYAGFLIGYQRWFYLRGPMLALILLAGLAGVVARWRRLGGLVLLPWAVAAALLIIPPMTAGYNSRFVQSAVPLACLAAALAAQGTSRTGAVGQPDLPGPNDPPHPVAPWSST